MQIYHGKIISLDKDDTIYQYLVEDNGQIVYLGDSLPDNFKKQESVVELKNKVLLPAFGDGHAHFSNWALIAGSYFDARTARTIPEIQKIIRQFLLKRPKLKAILAFGISKHLVDEKRLIFRSELDAACPDIPLIIVCYDGHSAVFNSKMFEKFPDKIRALRGFSLSSRHRLCRLSGSASGAG